jgi:hypothetical protein
MSNETVSASVRDVLRDDNIVGHCDHASRFDVCGPASRQDTREERKLREPQQYTRLG